jgi:FkbM family methyltransferase
VLGKLKRGLFINFNFARTLGTGVFGRIGTFLFLASLPLGRFIRGNRTLDATLKLQKFGKQFNFHLSHQLDIAILYDIFVEDEYGIQLNIDPQVIIDIGSNVGASLIYFALKYPEANLFGYEPDPHAFRTLARNVDGFKNIEIKQAAVAAEEGELEFFVDPDSSMSSSLRCRRDRQKKILVQTTTLDSILDEHGVERVDLLKFDVEGAEYEMFKNFRQMERVNNVIGELHVDLIDASKEQFTALLNKFNLHEEKLRLPGAVERYVVFGGSDIQIESA